MFDFAISHAWNHLFNFNFYYEKYLLLQVTSSQFPVYYQLSQYFHENHLRPIPHQYFIYMWSQYHDQEF